MIVRFAGPVFGVVLTLLSLRATLAALAGQSTAWSELAQAPVQLLGTVTILGIIAVRLIYRNAKSEPETQEERL